METSSIFAGRMSDESGSVTTNDSEEADTDELLPDWQLIDEVSIKLLEQGVGTFDTLQRVLPSIVLGKIDGINDESKSAEQKRPNTCSGYHLIKLFKLAQMEIDYLLRTQTDLLEQLTKEKLRAEKFAKENKTFRKLMGANSGAKATSVRLSASERSSAQVEGMPLRTTPTLGREFFRCNECSKIFLHATFLIDHIKRKHREENSLEIAATSIRKRREELNDRNASTVRHNTQHPHLCREVKATNNDDDDSSSTLHDKSDDDDDNRTEADFSEVKDDERNGTSEDTSLWHEI